MVWSGVAEKVAVKVAEKNGVRDGGAWYRRAWHRFLRHTRKLTVDPDC